VLVSWASLVNVPRPPAGGGTLSSGSLHRHGGWRRAQRSAGRCARSAWLVALCDCKV